MTLMTMAQATVTAIAEEMRRDPRVFLTGFGVTHYGGVYDSAKGLWEEFGDQRVIEMPMAETGYFGICAGAAMFGMRPIFDICFAEYIPYITEPLCTDMAAVYYGTAGKARVPIVVCARQGVAGNLSHVRGFNSWLTHVPGLKVVSPATPRDARGLWKSAIRDDNPVVILESLAAWVAPPAEVPEAEELVPIGQADVKRRGRDVTVIAAGETVRLALEAAARLAADGIEVEVIDLRTLAPIDFDTLVTSVRRTGRAVIVHTDWKIGGFGAEIAATLGERAHAALQTWIRRVAPLHVPPPFRRELEEAFLPSVDGVISAVREVLRG
ncbi:MAG: alpha-ketoacid dehydrogenase subunit beta [Gammaproteobacteria bacterium]|nr:alpha-ketoacid dehydrogenase subunit beta [Gammaproteobacteria bacterium]